MGVETTVSNQLTFREAYEIATAFVGDGEPKTAEINGVRVVFSSRSPLTVTYHYSHNGQETTYRSYDIYLNDSDVRLRRYANDMLANATEGDFPPAVYELLLDHAEILFEAAQVARPARERLDS